MKFSISEASFNKQRYFSVFGKRFPTRPEAVKYAEETIARREAAAGRELSRRELDAEAGIATEDRPLRERIAVVPQNERGYGGSKPTPATGNANPNALVWAEDALEKAKFSGAMSDVAAAEAQLAAVRSGAPPTNAAHSYMLPGDRVTRMSDGEIRILRKRDKYDAIIHSWPAAEAPAEIKTLAESSKNE